MHLASSGTYRARKTPTLSFQDQPKPVYCWSRARCGYPVVRRTASPLAALQAASQAGKVTTFDRFTTVKAMNATVTLSSKYQVVIPQAAREALSLAAGDELLVLCKSDRVVMIPKPRKFKQRTAGLHKEVWQGAAAYLKDERETW